MRFRSAWLSDLFAGFLAYLLTSAPVLLGVSFGIDFIGLNGRGPDSPRPDFLTACMRFDGGEYLSIAEDGYSYDPHKRSTVAFFPGYPLLSRSVASLTGWDTRRALFVVSNLMLLGTFVVFSTYLRYRWPESDCRSRLLVLALFGLWPAGVFFRMAYSESTFLFFTLLVLLGIVGRWPLPVLAAVTGLVTAVRPVGVAVTAALLWHVLRDDRRGPITRRLLLCLALSPLAMWGLLTYMAYQYAQFGAATAFAQTQEHWAFLGPALRSSADKIESLLVAEPLWAVYTADPARDWTHGDPDANPLFSLYFWNPILFALGGAVVVLGGIKRWLTGPEIVLGSALLAIPYITRAYEMSMASHARFAAVIVPAYLVLGTILQRQPEWVAWSVLCALSVTLMAWSALFAAGHPFY